MDYGVFFISHPDCHEKATSVEKMGFTHLWFGDSQMVWSDVYQCMALCATTTKTIKLGTNVTNPSSRIAPITANSFGTLNVLAPGRVVMGIGTGNTARRTLGMPAARLAELRSHVEVCRGLLRGETVPYQEGHRERMVRFLNPEGGFVNLNDEIPIYIAGSGPKTLELAGEIADGVILFGTVGDGLLEYTLSHVRRGAARAGKQLSDLDIIVLTAAHFIQPGESHADIQRAVGPIVASECNIFALSVKDPLELPEDIRHEIIAFKNAYRTLSDPIETRHLHLYTNYVAELKPEHVPLITERMIRETTLTGTPDEIRDRIRAMQALGVNQVAIGADETDISEFSKQVIQSD